VTGNELRAAAGKTIPDVLAAGLQVLFCGINPGLYSGAVGHHFARPGNRFWPTLHAAGFTPRRLRPDEQRQLIEFGCGLTNFVERTTASAVELSLDELVEGRNQLAEKVARYQPVCVAVLGIGAYRTAFGDRHARPGEQPHSLAGARVWVLPNPSGLNAHYQLDDLAKLFAELRRAVMAASGQRP
jgi:TDG/mug DNA glycosylase family protein